MDPHPAVGQQWPALRLHPVGDQLPRPARHRCLHPGRLLEEDQRAGDMSVKSPWNYSKFVSQHFRTETALKKQRSASTFSSEPPGISRPELFSHTLTLSVWFYSPHMGSRCQHLSPELQPTSYGRVFHSFSLLFLLPLMVPLFCFLVLPEGKNTKTNIRRAINGTTLPWQECVCGRVLHVLGHISSASKNRPSEPCKPQACLLSTDTLINL